MRVEDIARHPSLPFRRLDTIRGLAVDLRYASSNNFDGRVLYRDIDCAWLRTEACVGLKAAVAWLAREHPALRLVVLDALRPQRVQEAIWRDVAGTDAALYFADPARGGPSLVMGDIGTHAHQLLRFISGLEVGEVAAELGCVVPERSAHDFAGVLQLVAAGAGVALVPQLAVTDVPEGVILTALPIGRRTRIAYRAGSRSQPNLAAVSTELHRAAQHFREE